MSVTERAKKLYHQILTMVEISEHVARTSIYMTASEQEWIFKASSETLNDLEKFNVELKQYFNATTMLGVATGFLTYWNEAVSIDVEKFWDEMKRRNVEFKRVEPLRYTLKQGHFRNIYTLMSAKEHWHSLLDSTYLKANYTKNELDRLRQIMNDDEEKRITLLRKVLKTKKIALSNYLKFCETLGYFEEFEIMRKHFTEKEIQQLNHIKFTFELQHTTSATCKKSIKPELN